LEIHNNHDYLNNLNDNYDHGLTRSRSLGPRGPVASRNEELSVVSGQWSVARSEAPSVHPLSSEFGATTRNALGAETGAPNRNRARGGSRYNSHARTLRIQGNHAIHTICRIRTIHIWYKNYDNYAISNIEHFPGCFATEAQRRALGRIEAIQAVYKSSDSSTNSQLEGRGSGPIEKCGTFQLRISDCGVRNGPHPGPLPSDGRGRSCFSAWNRKSLHDWSRCCGSQSRAPGSRVGYALENEIAARLVTLLRTGMSALLWWPVALGCSPQLWRGMCASRLKHG
jgi:hypothetical protein